MMFVKVININPPLIQTIKYFEHVISWWIINLKFSVPPPKDIIELWMLVSMSYISCFPIYRVEWGLHLNSW